MAGEMLNVATRLILGTTPPVLLDNLTGLGLRIEWTVEKTRTSSPDQATIEVYNLAKISRKAVALASSLPLPLTVELHVGWSYLPELLFTGQAWKVVAERHTGPNIITTIEAGDGALPLRDTPPAGGAQFGIGIQLAVAKLLGELGLRPSPATLGVIASKAGATPVTAFQFVADGDPRDLLDQLMASIGLSWGISGGAFVVYAAGLRNDIAPAILAPISGLLEWTEADDGAVEFRALAQPRIEPGAQVSILDAFGATVGGGPLRVERLTFTGSSEGPSTMQGTARKVQVL